MRHEFKKISAALLAGVLGISFLNGCTSTKTTDKEKDTRVGQESTAEPTTEEKSAEEPTLEEQTTEEPTTEEPTTEETTTEEPTTEEPTTEEPATEEPTSSDDPSEFDMPALGLTMKLPDALMERMDQGSVIVFTNEIPMEDNSALEYGYVSWSMADGMQLDEGEIFLDEMQNAGMLGVYRAELADSLDELTGCDRHQELGESADGAYKYYLSVNTSADEELVKEIQQITAVITDMAGYEPYENGDEQQSGFSGSDVSSVGDFSTQDVNGNTVTQDIFKDYKLTMVNIFTTWCSPCVKEMPDLEKLYQQMKDRNVGVVGVVLNVLNEKGEIVEEDLERAQLLVKKTGVTYPVILPDSTYMNGRLTSIEAFPETFFVDQDGNIVGDTYSGSGSLEDWLETVEKELANLEAGA